MRSGSAILRLWQSRVRPGDGSWRPHCKAPSRATLGASRTRGRGRQQRRCLEHTRERLRRAASRGGALGVEWQGQCWKLRAMGWVDQTAASGRQSWADVALWDWSGRTKAGSQGRRGGPDGGLEAKDGLTHSRKISRLPPPLPGQVSGAGPGGLLALLVEKVGPRVLLAPPLHPHIPPGLQGAIDARGPVGSAWPGLVLVELVARQRTARRAQAQAAQPARPCKGLESQLQATSSWPAAGVPAAGTYLGHREPPPPYQRQLPSSGTGQALLHSTELLIRVGATHICFLIHPFPLVVQPEAVAVLVHIGHVCDNTCLLLRGYHVSGATKPSPMLSLLAFLSVLGPIKYTWRPKARWHWSWHSLRCASVQSASSKQAARTRPTKGSKAKAHRPGPQTGSSH
jgi:hypothetical protein